MVSKKKLKLKLKNWEKPKYIKQILPNGNTSHGGDDDQNLEIGNTSVDHTKLGKYNIDIIASRIKKYLDNESIRIGKKTIQYITRKSKHGFLKLNFQKKIKNRGFVSAMKKIH